MLYMNDFEIETYLERHRNHPVLLQATRFLKRFKELIDNNSDGWAYWKPAVRSAKNLMTLIKENPDPTEQEYKKTLTPIKSLCTKHKLPLPSTD